MTKKKYKKKTNGYDDVGEAEKNAFQYCIHGCPLGEKREMYRMQHCGRLL